MRGTYGLKPWFRRRLRRIEDALVERRVSPDALSWASVWVSITAGLVLATGGIAEEPLLWLLVPPLGIVRLALNALDGAIARRAGGGRPFGMVVNEVSDRLSDAALIGALAFVAEPWIAATAVAAAFLCSSVGSMGHLVGHGRLTSGPMGKADRVALVCLGAVAAPVVDEGVFTLVAGAIALGSIVTTALRIAELRREALHV